MMHKTPAPAKSRHDLREQAKGGKPGVIRGAEAHPTTDHYAAGRPGSGSLVLLVARREGIATRLDRILVADRADRAVDRDFTTALARKITLRRLLGGRLRLVVRHGLLRFRLLHVPAGLVALARDHVASSRRTTPPRPAPRDRRSGPRASAQRDGPGARRGCRSSCSGREPRAEGDAASS